MDNWETLEEEKVEGHEWSTATSTKVLNTPDGCVVKYEQTEHSDRGVATASSMVFVPNAHCLRTNTRSGHQMVKIGDLPDVLEKDDKKKFTGTTCSACGSPQYVTPSGATCKNGHGGEAAREPLP